MLAWSPLRYPGGKGQMYNFVLDLMKKNNLVGCNYIEPFAGGAGVAIRLLLEGYVESISINDFDRSIYAFWHCVLYETNRFTDKIADTSVDIETWLEQKEFQKRKEEIDLFTLGFSTFFLNRTNRSGILKGGPIGGRAQKGKYKIDCRFNKDRLISLIKTIASYRDKIYIYKVDGKEFIAKIEKDNIFCFVDPPYYKKGKGLYVNYFDHQDHYELSESIRENLIDCPFILTYDLCQPILDLYSFMDSCIIDLNYSLGKKRKAQEVLFASQAITIEGGKSNGRN